MTLRRFGWGLAALFLAFVLVHASAYGDVGRVLAHTTNRAIGSAGVALLVVILFFTAYVLLIPPRLRRWMWNAFDRTRGDTALPATVLPRTGVRPRNSEVPARRGRRQSGHYSQQFVVVGHDALDHVCRYGLLGSYTPPSQASVRVEDAAIASPPPSPARAIAASSPTVRMKLTDVESCLKNLGYRANEYEPVVSTLDPSESLETLVRQALAKLRKM